MAPRKTKTATKRKKTTTTRTRKKAKATLKDSTRRQIYGVGLIGLGIILMLVRMGVGGLLGEQMEAGLSLLFGTFWILFPVSLLVWGFFSIINVKSGIELKRTFGLLFCLFAFYGMVHLPAPFDQIWSQKETFGGIVGFMGSVPFFFIQSPAIGYTVLICLFVIGILISFEPDIGAIAQWCMQQLQSDSLNTSSHIKPKASKRGASSVTSAAKQIKEEEKEDLIEKDITPPELNIVRPAFAKKDVSTEKKESKKPGKQNSKEIEMKDTRFEEWEYPSLDLLDAAHSELKVDDKELKKQAKLIEEKLEEFGIDVTMRDAHPGPTVTQFTLQPAEGVKLSKIGSLKDDLALALAAQSLRIEAPIPGKALVGIEMPNKDRTTVHLREILESPEFQGSESVLALPLGRDVSGQSFVAELNDMPHLLIAGATGSGKSVCMNTILISLLYQNAPDQLKLILIDPKRVEMMPYDNIPHLLTPVITEAEKALQALRWCVAEMGRRLHRFSETGARNIDEYNDSQMDDENTVPRIVVIIDELADLMMRQHRRDTETMIARIAQMARAVGMHLIIATQRPSVDVITGLIKANIPTRIAFRVVSSVDSRTILDSIGAEDLLGKGDMLYQTASTPKPMRIQGIYVSTKEVERVINAVKIAGGGRITEQVALGEDEEDGEGIAVGMIDLDADDNGGDELFFEAVQVVQSTGKASASLLQRQLKVGYARAARLLDIMEEKGIVGPADGAKPRKIMIDKLADSA